MNEKIDGIDNSEWGTAYSLEKKYMLSIFKIKSLAIQGHIRQVEVEGRTLFYSEDVRLYLELVEDLEENYLSITQVAQMQGYNYSIKVEEASNKIKDICIKEGMKFKELDIAIFKGSYLTGTSFS